MHSFSDCSGSGGSATFLDEECPAEDLIIDDSFVTSSLVVDFGFLCDRSYLRTIYNPIYMLGMLVGSYFFGWFSDTFGRINAMMLSIITVSLSGFFG